MKTIAIGLISKFVQWALLTVSTLMIFILWNNGNFTPDIQATMLGTGTIYVIADLLIARRYWLIENGKMARYTKLIWKPDGSRLSEPALIRID